MAPPGRHVLRGPVSICCQHLVYSNRHLDVVRIIHVLNTYTVLPALGDPSRERPPDVYGHVVKVPTHLNVKLPAIGGHLPNADADSHLLVVRRGRRGKLANGAR